MEIVEPRVGAIHLGKHRLTEQTLLLQLLIPKPRVRTRLICWKRLQSAEPVS